MLWVYDLPQRALCAMVVAAYEVISLAFVHLLGPCLTIAMDHPFRGAHGIGPDPYELVRSQLMK